MKRFALIILLPVLLLYGCYRLIFPTYSWHQKLTLVVEAPLLVTFGDINDPASVRRVNLADLAATFGAVQTSAI